MAASEAQHIVNISLKKILASRSRRGGIDLHRNLLLASVLLKARDACVARTYDPCYLDEADNQDDVSTPVANNDERDDVDSRQGDVTLTSDAVPNCDENSEKECPDGAQVRWDVIPDQALEEWDFLGPDICSEQLEPEEGRQQKSDIKRPSNGNVDGGAVTDFPVLDVADMDLRTSGHRANSISRKRTIEIELGEGDSDDDSYGVSPHKKQKTDQTVNCENMCMDFDDLINSLEGDCSITSAEVLETSKDFVDKLAFELEFPITCDSGVCTVDETSALLSCQSTASGFAICRNDVAVSSAV